MKIQAKQYVLAWTDEIDRIYGQENLLDPALGDTIPAVSIRRMSLSQAKSLKKRWSGAGRRLQVFKLVRVK